MVSAPRRYFVTNTKCAWRFQTTERPLRMFGSGSHRGDIDQYDTLLGMKVTVRVKLTPDDEQRASLVSTLEVLNAACDGLSDVALASGVFRARMLQRAHYHDLKTVYGLGAQPALHVIEKVADAYTLDTRTKRSFSPYGAVAFDDRCLSWQVPEVGNGGTVSIWTVDGRLKGVRFVGRPADVARIRQYRRGETDLMLVDGELYLAATVDVPAPAVTVPSGWLGVDMGIVNIAVTSNGVVHSGKALNRYRKRQLALRAELQAKRTKAARRRLKARRRKETRHTTHVNHMIAKQIVAEAERTGHGIAVENLTGMRNRVRLRKPQRVSLNSWAFGQLGQHLTYKATQAGVALVQVDPRYTSQECAECGHIDRRNRPNQATFTCTACGVIATSADHNAARVIAKRAPAAWAAVNQPQPVKPAHAA